MTATDVILTDLTTRGWRVSFARPRDHSGPPPPSPADPLIFTALAWKRDRPIQTVRRETWPETIMAINDQCRGADERHG